MSKCIQYSSKSIQTKQIKTKPYLHVSKSSVECLDKWWQITQIDISEASVYKKGAPRWSPKNSTKTTTTTIFMLCLKNAIYSKNIAAVSLQIQPLWH